MLNVSGKELLNPLNKYPGIALHGDVPAASQNVRGRKKLTVHQSSRSTDMQRAKKLAQSHTVTQPA